MKSKLLLIVTEGCEACKIANNLTEAAISNSNLDITYEVTDVKQVPTSLLKEANVHDFPTTIMFKEGNVVDSYSGTKPISFIEKKIKLLL